MGATVSTVNADIDENIKRTEGNNIRLTQVRERRLRHCDQPTPEPIYSLSGALETVTG